MKGRLLALGASLALFGCAPQGEYRFAFEGPPEDRQAAETAAAQWTACGTVSVAIVDGSDVDATIRLVGEYPESKPGIRVVHGKTSIDRETISYVDRGPRTNVRTIAHEMGHVMGVTWARHLGVHPDSLMAADPHVDHVTPYDCAALANR